MQMLARYLQAVRFWLPKGQQDDIVAELREDLASLIEERERALGHKLDDAELAAILKQYGRPFVVANRFLPQEQLIGPSLFPMYRFVLKIVAFCYLLPWLTVLIVLSSFDHGHGTKLANGLPTFWTLAFTAFGVVTIVFALIERTHVKSELFENWDPRKLPPVRTTGKIKLSSSVAEIIANLALAYWWIYAWFAGPVFAPFGFRVVLAPAWKNFFWAIFLVLIANVAISTVNLFRPSWTLQRIWVRFALDSAGSAIFCWLMKAQLLVTIYTAQSSPEEAAKLVGSINTYIAEAFPYSVAACLLIVAISTAVRLLQFSRPGLSAAFGPAIDTQPRGFRL